MSYNAMSALTGDFNTFATPSYNFASQGSTPTASSSPASFKSETTKKKGDKTHPCPVEGCVDKSGQPRMFACPHNVAQHVREKHTDARPYKCTICPDSRRGFNRPFTLNRHVEKLHGIKIGPGKGHGSKRAKKAKARTARSSPARTATCSPATTAMSSPIEQVNAQPCIDFNAYTPRNTMLMQTQQDMNDNTVFSLSQCKTCDEFFFDLNSALEHHHTHHGEQPSPFCTCAMCNSVYRGDAADMIELSQQLEPGGFGLVYGAQHLVDEAQGEDLEFLLCESSHNNPQGVTLSNSTKPGGGSFVGMYADELFSAATLGGGEKGPYSGSGVVSCGNEGFVAYQLGEAVAEHTEEYGVGGGIESGDLESEGLASGDEDFDLAEFIDMKYVACTEATDVEMVEAC